MQLAQPRTFANLASTRSLTSKVVFTLSASLLVALAAHISVPLPFTPVPLTLQTFAVILVGLVLGPQLACAAMVLYLAEGAAGLPVFSPHGLGGVAQLLGPTGGFLLSYPFAAATAGFLVRRLQTSIAPFAAALVAGFATALIFLTSGASWLAVITHINFFTAAKLAIVPFAAEEVLKVFAAATAFVSLHRTQSAR